MDRKSQRLPRQPTSLPDAAWPLRRKVLTSSPSPQTVMPLNRLNDPPIGTSGAASSHCANSPSWSGEISRARTRSSRWSRRVGGKLRRRILGIALRAVKAADNGLPDARSFHGVLCIDQTFSQGGQLRTAELSLGIELTDEAHDTGLFFRGETFDLVNDLRRGHRARLIRGLEIIKLCRAVARANPKRALCGRVGRE